MFRRILVAIDGSDHASQALREAIDLAQANHATLTVMTTVPDPATWLLGGAGYPSGVDLERLAEETERDYRRLLENAVETLPDDLPVTKILAHGRPAERIIEQLRGGTYDLLVIGSRGRGEMRSLLLGSVSHQVLNASPAAVLIVHTQEDGD